MNETMTVQNPVSADFQTTPVLESYEVKGRKNIVHITLSEMPALL